MKNNISPAAKKLLYNPDFLMWCLVPTNDSDKEWSQWLEKHPEMQEAIAEARTIILSTQLNKYALSPSNTEKLSVRIQESYKQHKKKHRYYLVASYAAACVILICVIGSWFFFSSRNTLQTDSNQVAQIQIETDSIQTEVILELPSKKTMVVANKATIRLKPQGNLQINNKNEKIATPQEDTETKQKTEKEEMNVLKVPRGRHSSVILADGTKVWVNSGTTLRFPSTFDEDNRTIYANGEIYLEVTKDTSRPFYVKTSRMDVRVLGTSFNVTAYEDEGSQSVVLAEGSVEVNNLSGQVRRIRPQEMLTLANNTIDIVKVNTYDYISWKDGVFQFEKKKLEYVIQRLARYYNVEFDYDPRIGNYLCTGKLVLFDDIDKVLLTLKESFSVSYEINENKIKLSTNLKN